MLRIFFSRTNDENEKLIVFRHVNEIKIKIIITHNKNMKHTNMRIKNDYKIHVKSSYFSSEKQIDNFIAKNIEKFAKDILALKHKALFNFEKKYIYLFGEKKLYSIQKVLNYYILNFFDLRKFKIKKIDENSMLNFKKKFLKHYLNLYLKNNQLKFEELLNLHGHDYKIVYKKTTWATININKKHISYNSQSAHFQTYLIDYIIIHELCHNFHANHSAAFWNKVKEFAPNYKKFQKELSRKG